MSRSKNFISLAEHNPELIVEWHPTRNGDLTPNDISYGSAKKVWWLGKCGHEWEQNPNHRSRGRGCPICAQVARNNSHSKNWIAQYGSLADNNPELAKQWHPSKNEPLTAKDVSAGSGNKAWWICPEGHEWEAVIASRNKGVGCPVCSGHKIVVGINDLATVRPDLAKQWHPTKNGDLTPEKVTIHNGKKVWWICEKGHEWNAKISNRANGNNCPICIGKQALAGYNDLATIMPSLAKEWHPTLNGDLRPQNVTVGSNKKVWWQCEKGHEWKTSVCHRANGRRCPKCFGESKTSFPEQAIFFYLKQITVAHNRYKLDHRTEIDIYLPEYKIGIEYDGLYYHNGEKAKKREKQKQEKLDSLDITLIRVRELKDEENDNVFYSKPGANDLELNKTISQLYNRITNLVGISMNLDIDIARDRNKIYEQYIQQEKEHSLAIVNPELAAEWHPIKNGTLLPEYVSFASSKKVWWLCNQGHEWQAQINSRTKGAGCPECYKLKRKVK